MKILTDIQAMQERALAERARGGRIVLVPTMGWLHEGHLSLLRAGRQRGDLLVLSVFVNPAQFGQGEDFESYPRDLQRDAELAEAAGTDLLFAPEAAAMYPRGYATFVDVEGLTEGLCGRSRPGHFRGVTTVVAKLFAIVQPHAALFGRKDFQQLAVIRRMTRDLNLPVEIHGMPIVREADGLAMSSRNVYLSAGEREEALVLQATLAAARKMVAEGVRDTGVLLARAREMIGSMPATRIDYVEICHRHTLEPQRVVDTDSVLLLAAHFGRTRLIDNGLLHPGSIEPAGTESEAS